MKIAVIGTRGFPDIQGGVEQHCEKIYPRMKNDDKIIVYRRKDYLTSQSQVSYSNISYIDLPSTRIKGFEALFHTFLCCLHLIFHRVDIVHIHNIGPGLFTLLLRMFGIKVVLTYHSANYEHDKWGKVSKMILKFSEYLSLNFANKIIFVNKFQMKKYSSDILQKSIYIPNGVENTTCSDQKHFIEKYGIIENNYVLGVGRLTPEKGFEYLISAINKTDEIPQLVIAGASDHDKSYLEKLKQLDINNKVVFTGFTSGEDLRQLYSHARMFVLSSLNEGFPLVMLEAMGYGLPMVLSDIPATHLIEFPDEFYAKKGNVESFINQIKTIWHLPKQVYDLSEFDWNSIADKTQSLYKKV